MGSDEHQTDDGEPGGEPGRYARSWRWGLYLLLFLGVVYGLLQNGQYAPAGGDDALYLSIARDAVRGGEGGPLSLRVPPGWPALLAGALAVHPSFLLINAMAAAFLLGAALLWYRILLRLLQPAHAALAVAFVGVMFEWHRFAYTLYTEPPFYVLMAAAVLLALQVGEGRPAWWRLPAMLLACVGLVLTRWVGLVAAPVVAGALLQGEMRPALNQRWVRAVLVCLVFAATFFGVRAIQRLHAMRRLSEARDAATRAHLAGELDYAENRTRDMFDRPVANRLRRCLRGGEWITNLLWPPTAVGRGWRTVGRIANVAGWILLAFLAAWTVGRLRRGEWLWAGAALYCGALFLEHSRPVARYLAPLAPLIVCGVTGGMLALADAWRPPAWRRLTRLGACALLASVLLCNAAILAGNLHVMRAPGFVHRWCAGEYAEILSLAQYLESRSVADREVATEIRYAGPYREGAGSWARRMIRLVVGVECVRLFPGDLPTGDEREQARALRARGVRFLLARPEVLARRIWHVRLPPRGGEPSAREGPVLFYVLYEVGQDGLREVELPPVSEGIRRVPGL